MSRATKADGASGIASRNTEAARSGTGAGSSKPGRARQPIAVDLALVAIVRTAAKGDESMVEAIILTDDILGQARTWRDDCVRRWNAEGIFPRIGEATVTSPVDGKPRKIVLYLSHGFDVKGKIFPGVRSEEGEVIEEGSTIVLNREKIDLQREPLMPILLHEVTHAVDPCFDEDMKRREENPEQFKDWRGQYGLASEQRAFAAMWTEDLREDLERGQYQNPGASLLLYGRRSHEFDGFYAYGQLTGHDLIEQMEDHFRKIVEDLKERKEAKDDKGNDKGQVGG